ncbi:hypothetical protein [Pseudonocardia nigra]|uniref:hypothetical protein n=1 Tax=Pseudonocardia nigra TaxID=1921578 RepID=UPI001C5D57B7|nr:hypothetical protein [Pseudonocardia nigra]
MEPSPAVLSAPPCRRRAVGSRVGYGFITWLLAEQPDLLDTALERGPAAVTLSFGDPGPFAARIRDAGVPLGCQVSGAAEARRALDAGVDGLSRRAARVAATASATARR